MPKNHRVGWPPLTKYAHNSALVVLPERKWLYGHLLRISGKHWEYIYNDSGFYSQNETRWWEIHGETHFITVCCVCGL